VSTPAEHGAARGNPPWFDPTTCEPRYRVSERIIARRRSAGDRLSQCCRFVLAVTFLVPLVYGPNERFGVRLRCIPLGDRRLPEGVGVEVLLGVCRERADCGRFARIGSLGTAQEHGSVGQVAIRQRACPIRAARGRRRGVCHTGDSWSFGRCGTGSGRFGPGHIVVT